MTDKNSTPRRGKKKRSKKLETRRGIELWHGPGRDLWKVKYAKASTAYKFDTEAEAREKFSEMVENNKPIPSQFFEVGTGLLIRSLAEEIEMDRPIATGLGRKLYYYEDGVWVPDGEREVRDRARVLLDERYRSFHGTSVVDWFANQRPLFYDDTGNTQYLNLPNGLLDWRTGELIPHKPEVGRIPRIPVEWHPEATCPTIHEWLQGVLYEDCIELAYEIIGYALYNGLPIHIAILLYASGRNGKGTYIRLLNKLLGGQRNVASVSPQDLDSNRFATADLHGMLANMVGDVDPVTFKTTENFKKATGGDVLRAEHKNAQPFTFTSKALNIASFNKLPRSADVTPGFFARWKVLPFTGYFPDGVADSSVEDKMQSTAELQGLLVAAVERLRIVIGRNALSSPDSVREATQAFRVSADPVRKFLQEHTEGSTKSSVHRTKLYSRYESWADMNNYPVERRDDFYASVKRAVPDMFGVEIEEGKSRGSETFKGLRLLGPELVIG